MWLNWHVFIWQVYYYYVLVLIKTVKFSSVFYILSDIFSIFTEILGLMMEFTHSHIPVRKCFDGVYPVISRYIRVLHKQEVGHFSILYGKLTWGRCQFQWHSFVSDTYAYKIKGDILPVPRLYKLEGILTNFIFWYLTEVF